MGNGQDKAKPQEISKYIDQLGILFEDGRLEAEFQSQDLDQVNLEYLESMRLRILSNGGILWYCIHT